MSERKYNAESVALIAAALLGKDERDEDYPDRSRTPIRTFTDATRAAMRMLEIAEEEVRMAEDEAPHA